MQEKCLSKQVLLTCHSFNISPTNHTECNPKLDILQCYTKFEANSDQSSSFSLQSKLKQEPNHLQKQNCLEDDVTMFRAIISNTP